MVLKFLPCHCFVRMNENFVFAEQERGVHTDKTIEKVSQHFQFITQCRVIDVERQWQKYFLSQFLIALLSDVLQFQLYSSFPIASCCSSSECLFSSWNCPLVSSPVPVHSLAGTWQDSSKVSTLACQSDTKYKGQYSCLSV